MACNGGTDPPQIGNPPSSKIFYPLPPILKLFTPPPTGNKKHEDVKLMYKSLILHNSWQIKKNKVKSEEIQ